ncbi:MAG: hypothetical protein ACK8QZ_04675, partial [Anaerolineales bacterium]
LEVLNTELSERIAHLQQETSQRDDTLRSELIAQSRTLGEQKVSRREISQLLLDLAQRLQSEE